MGHDGYIVKSVYSIILRFGLVVEDSGDVCD